MKMLPIADDFLSSYKKVEADYNPQIYYYCAYYVNTLLCAGYFLINSIISLLLKISSIISITVLSPRFSVISIFDF